MNTYYVYTTEMKLLATVEANKFHLDNGGACFYKGTAPVSSLCAYIPKPCIILTEPNEVKPEGKSKMKIYELKNKMTGEVAYIAGYTLEMTEDSIIISAKSLKTQYNAKIYSIKEFTE
jgi:hypothetical protein